MQLEVTDNRERTRFEIRADGVLAGFAEYQLTPDLIVFTHTEIEPTYEGKGVGSALVRESLEDVRATGREILPLCPFYKAWIAKHPEYQDIVYVAAPGNVKD